MKLHTAQALHSWLRRQVGLVEARHDLIELAAQGLDEHTPGVLAGDGEGGPARCQSGNEKCVDQQGMPVEMPCALWRQYIELFDKGGRVYPRIAEMDQEAPQ